MICPRITNKIFGRLSVAAAAVLLLSAAPPSADYDIVIRNGRVLDGGGNPWVRADVAIKDGRVIRVGEVPGHGEREIDATDRYVAPGFIDMMDQSGEVLLEHGAAGSKLLQGVTTLIAGEGGTPGDAADIPAFFARLERQGIAVNFGTYYASHQARVKVMGDGAGAPTTEQVAAMRREVASAMRAGAFGVSSALIYPPSSFQSTNDLIALAQEAGRCDGFYSTHLRDESARLVEAVQEAIVIGERSGAKVEIFHLKAAFAPGWGTLMPQALATIDAARGRGIDVAADLYPYVAGGTGLEVSVPNWVWADGEAKGLERLRDTEVRARIKRELAAGPLPDWTNIVYAAGGWRNVRLANANSAEFERFGGQSFDEIGEALGRDPADVAWDMMLAAAPKRALGLFFLMSEDDIATALRRPWVSIGSDAAVAVELGAVDATGLPHPRAYGTFPRIIAEYVQARGVLTLEDAVRRMTSWPAQRMGLSDRGLIREGLRADIVLFDPFKVRDNATWEAPTAIASGIDTVIVNGRVTIDEGRHTGARAGMVLRHDCPATRSPS